MKNLYPEIDPHISGFLPVSSLHALYYEVSGNPDGIPAVFLHGGPGSGSAPVWRRYFDPEKYRIVMFDQRGCGKSTPYACLEENTTAELVTDIERLRKHLGVEKWLVVGGSWGSTLALAYAQSHTKSVEGLILYGLFLGTSREISWFYQSGASFIQPEAWDDFQQLIAEDQRHEMVASYYRLLNSGDEILQAKAAYQWSLWEARGLRLIPDLGQIEQFVEPEKALAQARIECHFMANECFLPENHLTKNIPKIKDISCTLIHGRYDLICPVTTAWEMKKLWTEISLIVVPAAGHSAREPGIQHEIISATDAFLPAT